MATSNDSVSGLQDHPIFSGSAGPSRTHALELSTATLRHFCPDEDDGEDASTSSGRRQVMVLRDEDLIVASGKELRIAALKDLKSARTNKGYKTMYTPNIEFDIHQLALNPGGKLLAIAGSHQVAVVVLPHAGYARLVPTAVDCKSVQVGQFYHASNGSPPVAKIEWHPWGEAGSVLLVMTTDGKFREYDISIDPEEPAQVLSFVTEKKGRRYMAEEREVSSFAIGKGKADWGPLTLYALMRNGDIYSISPYMPRNASVPSSYVLALQSFVNTKQEILSDQAAFSQLPVVDQAHFPNLYDLQSKYVASLVKQLPPSSELTATSRYVSMHAPATIKSPPLRQGPFFLKPSPRNLEGSEGGDATDMVYVAFEEDEEPENDSGETDQLGVILVAFQDGKVDVYMDVEKAEPKWEYKQEKRMKRPLPYTFAVYESIDLGLVSTLSRTTPKLLELLQGNHPVFHRDPIHDGTIYVYHAFGVHALDLGPVFSSLGAAIRDESNELGAALNVAKGTDVRSLVTTFSIERRSSNPVTAVAIPNNVYATYSLYILTSAMRVVSFPLTTETDQPLASQLARLAIEGSDIEALPRPDGPPAYVSLLGTEPFQPAAALARAASGLPAIPRLAGPSSQGEFRLTPETMRYLGTTVERFRAQIRDIQLAHQAAEGRSALQLQELARQQETCGKMLEVVERLRGARQETTQARMDAARTKLQGIMTRLDRILQAMMQKASPELSEHETKWFRELNRMKQEVKGAGRYDDASLSARTKLLEREFARLSPALKDMHNKEAQRKLLEASSGLGASQAFEFGERSQANHVQINDLERKVRSLASRLDVTLPRPPAEEQTS